MLKQFAVATMALVFSGAALAAGPGQKPMESKVPSFNDLDKNDNGGISRSEAKAYPALDEIFSAVDADKNGELLAGEYRNATRKLKS